MFLVYGCLLVFCCFCILDILYQCRYSHDVSCYHTFILKSKKLDLFCRVLFFSRWIISASLSGLGLGFGPIVLVPSCFWYRVFLFLWNHLVHACRSCLFLASLLHSGVQYFCLLCVFVNCVPQIGHFVFGFFIWTFIFCLRVLSL